MTIDDRGWSLDAGRDRAVARGSADRGWPQSFGRRWCVAFGRSRPAVRTAGVMLMRYDEATFILVREASSGRVLVVALAAVIPG